MIRKLTRFTSRSLRTYQYRLVLGNSTLRVGSGTEIRCRNVSIGEHVEIDQNVFIGGELNGSLVVGNHSKINSNVKLDTTGSLQVGSSSVISEFCILYTHGHGGDPFSDPRPYSLVIGNNVWVGARTLILPSVREIPDNTIIPAGSVIR